VHSSRAGNLSLKNAHATLEAMQWAKKQTGFTIVELLIVVVVIAILAAITIVSYNGVTNRAYDSAVQSNLSAAGKRLEQFKIENSDKVPVVTDWESMKIALTRNAYGNAYQNGTGEHNFVYCRNDATFGIVAATKSGKVYKYVSGQGVSEYTATFAGSTTTCPAIGISTSSTGYDNRWAYSSSVWTSMTL
jgi:prepilin-type N-terminal cleavage/methylation domain-containing protein